jgi:hypothetical protein
MQINDAASYETPLRELIALHSIAPVHLEFVDCVRSWCVGNGFVDPPDPVGMALRDRESGIGLILIRRSMDEDRTAGVLGRLSFAGHPDVEERLSSEVAFLSHLVLHELAHLQNGWGQEDEDSCDDWAFERL